MKDENLNHDLGGKIGKVTRKPDFYLTLEGYFDSLKENEEIIDARIYHYLKICTKLEEKEALVINNRCAGVRDKCAEVLTRLPEYTRQKKAIPDKISEKTPYAIRANKTNASSRAAASKAIADEKVLIVKSARALTYADTVLIERIKAPRDAFWSKMQAYIRGVRMGKLPDYSPSFEPGKGHDAYSIYRKQHEEDDALIYAVARNYTTEVTDNGNV